MNKWVELYLAGKTRYGIIHKYKLTPSVLDKYGKQAQTKASFREKDNQTLEQKELFASREGNLSLEIENAVLSSLCFAILVAKLQKQKIVW